MATVREEPGVLSAVEARILEVLSNEPASIDEVIRAVGLPAGAVSRVGDRVRLQVAEASISGLVAAVEAAGGRILSVQPIRQSLEDFFFAELGGSEAAARALEAEL